MGYSCPVCGDPQADARHLANHLAFTALVRGGDHEAWLDDHVPEWESMDEEGLAPEVADQADETEYPQVFEDTTEHHDHSHEANSPDLPDDVAVADLPDQDDLSAEAADAIERARELTRQRHDDDEDEA
ncbi:hypothetical protein SAMN05216226_101104 [Halovenus aranensis]|uniref:Uncharacterized protein n=1 Tax=Halovenus aranensis TaxID=890420 RepID=A0A1G8RUV7_9EURY|nr:DUF5810 domain-containing protein [Halovenus aranensis]SDJ20110.1 hypothetical protein SAMN05216226_101104 [Halovenus aranensis]